MGNDSHKPLGQLASEIEEAPVDWLDQPYFARGKLAEVIGDPGAAKTSAVISYLAGKTTGRGFLDADGCAVGPIALVSAEDDAATTLIPRFRVGGADLRLVRIIPSARATRDGIRPLTFPDDIELLEQTLLADGTVALGIDPITAFFSGKVDSHNDASARRVLAELQALAQRARCAIISIRHLNKMGSVDNSLYRGGGSIAFTAAARTSFLIGFDPTDDAPEIERRRVFACVKNNLAPKPQSRAFRLRCGDDSVAHVEWLAEPCPLTADDLLRVHHQRKSEALEEAVLFLEDELGRGDRSVNEVIEHAQQLKITDRTLTRARKIAGVRSYKKKFAGERWLTLVRDQDDLTIEKEKDQ